MAHGVECAATCDGRHPALPGGAGLPGAPVLAASVLAAPVLAASVLRAPVPGVAMPGALRDAAPLEAALRRAAADARPGRAARPRAKLWELHASTHCSVIGTCLDTAELRRVMGRYARHDVSHLSDHDLHAEAVGLAAQPGACARLLHKALDERHQGVVRRLGRLSGEAAVLEAWAEARRAGDIPGAYWAVLTHPDTGPAGLRQAFGDVHMLSHLVGAANRADIRRLAALEEERAGLLAKVERQQASLREAVTSRDATIRRLGALVAAQARAVPGSDVRDAAGARDADDPPDAQVAPRVAGAQDVRHAAGAADAQDALAGCRELVAALQARLCAQAARCGRLEARLADVGAVAGRWEGRARAAEAGCRDLARELALLERHGQPAPASPRAPSLPPERVLYVGGRPGCTGRMAEALAEAGGELLTHDGGRHDHPSLLAGLVSRADRVLFPVDCVSHDAALSVKRLCRQLGRPWAALRSSGLASFLAALDGAPDPTHNDEDAVHEHHHAP